MDGHISQEQADEYAIGALDREIAAMVALHADDCSRCRARIAESERVSAALLLGVSRKRPSPRLKHRVLRSAGIIRPGPVTRVLQFGTAGAGIAAVIVAIAALTGLVTVRGQIRDIRDENASLQRQINDALSQQVEIAALTRRLTDAERTSAELLQSARGDRDLLLALLSPEADVAEVISVNESVPAIGRLVWDNEQKKVWFVASKLAVLPQGQTYQVWVNSGGRYVALGTFNADATGYARWETLLPQGLSSYENAVVTIERAPGSQERSGPSVFVTDLSRLRR